MRLTTWFAGACVLVAFGFFVHRIVQLEHVVARLDKSSARTSLSAATSFPEPRSASAGNLHGVEADLQSFEKRVEVLEKAPPSSLVAGKRNPDEGRLQEERAILSVIERESTRARDAQLDWHKVRWLDARKQHLAAFADSQKLEPAQTSKLNAAVEDELNALVEVMKRPGFAEDPDEVADDWLHALSETDRRAQEVLDPGQYQNWLQGRFLGRKLLWPWLPDKPKETIGP